MCKLIDPTEGSIRIDDLELEDANVFDWRSEIGYVQQDSTLFNDSIKASISYGTRICGDSHSLHHGSCLICSGWDSGKDGDTLVVQRKEVTFLKLCRCLINKMGLRT